MLITDYLSRFKKILFLKYFSRLKKDPADVAGLLQEAMDNHEKGELAEAGKLYQHILKLHPGHSKSYYLLGVIDHQEGRDTDALEKIKRAIELTPDKPEFYSGCGEIYTALGDYDSAIGCYTRALELKPDFMAALYHLGNTCEKLGDINAAGNYYKKAIELNPGLAGLYYDLGNIQYRQGHLEEAIQSLKQAVSLDQGFPGAYNNLGFLYSDTGRLSDAFECFKKAVSLKPDFAEAHNNLGNLYKDTCQHAVAIKHYEKALSIKPDYAEAHSNLLLCMNYQLEYTPDDLIKAHKEWAQAHALPLSDKIPPHPNAFSSASGRRLRIGYLSPDFHTHSVARFVEPIFKNHDRNKFEIYAYSNSRIEDAMTKLLQQFSDHWRNIHGRSDEEVTHIIRQDMIDILVDLAGHTAGNRMAVFAMQPAPVQVTYLGYPATTGIPAIEYRLTDATADPQGLTDDYHTEKLVRLPHCFLCYQPSDKLLDINELPSLTSNSVTFACFNNYTKINDYIIEVWTSLLNQLPGSGILLKSHQLSDEKIRTSVLKRLQDKGMDVERVELTGWIESFEKHMDIYNRTDIALDTYPYNGTTTTCEALWMGIPVITLAGNSHHSRVGASIMTNAGFPEFIAGSPEEYVQLAVNLAKDTGKLSDIRNSLRAKIRRSHLTDAKNFTSNIENVYLEIWEEKYGLSGTGR